ncbi:hypothetical protein L596_000419 [Steinernema carpocapsae]|uniref:WAP domain-containing protein n=1 Tax=Steinernema carpocapsae TaxID=34508 RepID=A0A4U8UHZ9_STECR|nr:hypothetical protein L596_000419 [Steinernema carpocapsae]
MVLGMKLTLFLVVTFAVASLAQLQIFSEELRKEQQRYNKLPTICGLDLENEIVKQCTPEGRPWPCYKRFPHIALAETSILSANLRCCEEKCDPQIIQMMICCGGRRSCYDVCYSAYDAKNTKVAEEIEE